MVFFEQDILVQMQNQIPSSVNRRDAEERR